MHLKGMKSARYRGVFIYKGYEEGAAINRVISLDSRLIIKVPNHSKAQAYKKKREKGWTLRTLKQLF